MSKEVTISRIKVFAHLKGGPISIAELAAELNEVPSWIYYFLLPMTGLVEIEDNTNRLSGWHERQYSKVTCKLTQEGKKVSDLAYLYCSVIENLDQKLEKETKDFNEKLDKILSPK